MSEANEMRKYASANPNGNDEKDEKYRTSSLKIPSAIKIEQQQTVSSFTYIFFFFFVQEKQIGFFHLSFDGMTFGPFSMFK